MGICVGIDLGASYSKMAYVNDIGIPTIIGNTEGSMITPSAVYLSDTYQSVGQEARDLSTVEPYNVFFPVEALFYKGASSFMYFGIEYSSEEMTSHIIKKLLNDASLQLGEDIVDAVVALPNCMDTGRFPAVKKAFELAGINLIGSIDGIAAVALSYGIENLKEKGQNILIYDLGGCSFKTAVVTIIEDHLKIICSGGIANLGGNRWDEKIRDYLLNKFRSATGILNDFDESEIGEFTIKAENIKLKFSDIARNVGAAVFTAGGLREKVQITRAIYEELTEELLKQTIRKTDAIIRMSESMGNSVDTILLVGGSTRMPQVYNALIQRYGIRPIMYDPAFAVAKGAAIYAKNLNK